MALAGVVLVAWGVRVLPFWRLGTLSYALDYDEGVYFSAAALLWHGVLPYRDFIFVHPPGALWLEGLAAAMTSQVGVDTGLQAARWLAAAVGALNVLAVGRLAGRTWGGVAGVFAALAYAVHPEAVGLERGPFLEPWLNLACLALANAWLVRPAPDTPSRAWAWAGVFAGMALSVKVLGGLWLAAALLSPPSRAPGSASSPAPALVAGSVWREGAGLGLVAGATVLLLVGPLLAAAPMAFVQQVFGFHARRPPDGIFGLERLHEIFNERRWGTMLLGLGGWGLAVGRAFRAESATRPAERFFAATYALTLAAFLASPSYWSQYNAYLAASESVLAGLAAGALAGALSRGAEGREARGWRRGGRWGALVLGVGGVVLGSLPAPWRGARQRLPAQRTLAAGVRARVPSDASLCAFEPAWALVAGRLPARLPAAPRVVVDPYALMLRDALSSGGPFADTGEALGTPAAQRDVRRWLAQCRFVVLGGRGAWQLSAESHQWFESRFTRRFLDEAAPGLDLWERDGPAP